MKNTHRGETLGAAFLTLVGASMHLSSCERAPKEIPIAELVKPAPVFILGFDGLDPELVARFENENLLPNFRRLREEGAVGEVRSTIPIASGPAWTSLATGTTPGDHGIWDFPLVQENATRRLAPALWEDLTRSNRTVGVVNVPVTCPPDSVNGLMISGPPYPEGAPLTFPPELEEEITKKGYLRDLPAEALSPGEESEEKAWLESNLRVVRSQRTVGLELLFERRPDLSFIVFTIPEKVQSFLWYLYDPLHPRHATEAPDALRNAVRDVYGWCDDVLGEVLERLPKSGVLFVVSDHGFGPAYRGVSIARLVAGLPDSLREKARLSDLPDGSFYLLNWLGGNFYLNEATLEEGAEFANVLARTESPEGNRLVRAVHDTRAQPVRGFGLSLGPDIVVEEEEGYLFVSGSETGPLVLPLTPTSVSGRPRRMGYFAAFGPPIVAGPLRDIDLTDVTALTLHVLGEKIPTRYSHNVPRKIFPVNYFVWRPMLETGAPAQDGLRHPRETARDLIKFFDELWRSASHVD